jgi:hypothetical protein
MTRPFMAAEIVFSSIGGSGSACLFRVKLDILVNTSYHLFKFGKMS